MKKVHKLTLKLELWMPKESLMKNEEKKKHGEQKKKRNFIQRKRKNVNVSGTSINSQIRTNHKPREKLKQVQVTMRVGREVNVLCSSLQSFYCVNHCFHVLRRCPYQEFIIELGDCKLFTRVFCR